MGLLSVAFCCVLLIVSQHIDAHYISSPSGGIPIEVDGTLIRPILATLARTLNSIPDSCRNIYGPVCGDCSTLWTCAGSDEPVVVQNCTQYRPGRPLCHNNACVASVPADSQCSSQLTCTGTGYYPNPTNCSQYYYCEEASHNAASKVYECPVGYTYNLQTARCRWGENCTQIDCYEKANQFVAHPNSSIYYAFCTVKLGVSMPIMFRCPNDHLNHTFFDEDTLKCEFKCPREGRFIDYQDPNAFYECLNDQSGNGEWLTTRQTCPIGLVFDGFQQSCRKRYQMSTCAPTPTV